MEPSDRSTQSDVAIVGAGPAGARAAYLLARRGARVTLFDGSHPREKPCGGGVTGRALALVSDAVNPAAFPNTVVRSARFTRTLSRVVGDSCRSLSPQVGVKGRSQRPESEVGVEGRSQRSESEVGVEGRSQRSESKVGVKGRSQRSESEVGVKGRRQRSESWGGGEGRCHRSES